MFYYYGRKKRIAGLYPEPECDLIVEPFAGSAAYSLHGERWKKQVVLIDNCEWLVRLWKYLQQASVQDIENLPLLEQGQKVTDFQQLCSEERDLIGLHINPGSAVPKVTCSRFNRWKPGRKYIAENLHKIRHWKICLGDYQHAENCEAMWFIDPPYSKSGRYYERTQLDYDVLREWVLCRMGQVIVCEMEGADWLPFESLTETVNTGRHRCREVCYAPGR